MGRTSTFASLVGIVLGGTVAGCASPDNVVAGRPGCSSQPVQIKQIVPHTANPANRSLTLDHEPAHACKMTGDTVRWQMTGQAAQMYSFTDDGIEFRHESPQGGPPTRGKKQFDWVFPPSSTPPPSITYKYTINFREAGDGPDSTAKKWTCDPTVVSSDGRDARRPGPPATFTCLPLP